MGRFTSLVDTLEKRESFKAKYNISPNVTIEHYEMGDQYMKRPTSVTVIPMIAFIERGMRIPMDNVMRDFLIYFRLCPTQSSLNLFKIVNSIARLNEKMDANLTHHDVN